MSDDLQSWLEAIGLGQFSAAFAENSITWQLLPELTAEDLNELGLNIGQRRQFFSAVAKLDKSDPSASARTAPADLAERRQLTVMFCDLVGSTDLSGKLDPEDLRTVVRAYQEAAEAVIERFDGHIAQYLGDGLLVYFGYPVAHEDDAQRAVHAGIGISEAMTGLNRQLQIDYSVNLSVRIGIHTGPVVVGEMGGKNRQENLAMGETPNLAARLEGLAKPGSVVISEATRQLLREQFDLASLGEQHLKGIAAPINAFSVRGVRLTETRFAGGQSHPPSAMVGREQELTLLLERWRLAQAGHGQMVVLTGAAGIGKSRIINALIESVAHVDYQRLSYQCSPYHADTAFYPVIQQLRLAAAFEASDSPQAKLDKLEHLLAQAPVVVSDATPLIGALLGLSDAVETRYGQSTMNAQQRRVRTLETLSDQMIGSAATRPVLCLIEDAHWIDPTTIELITLLLEQFADQRFLLIITARPTFQQPFNSGSVTELSLDRLGRDQAAQLIARVAQGKKLPSKLVDLITDKTDGVPLYVEELTKSVLESSGLRETLGSAISADAMEALAIPTTLRDSLMARLDHHQPLKSVAQTAACIGREFDYALLMAVTDRTAEQLTDELDQLVNTELIFQRGTPPQANYSFKHALVRDAAYDSLLKANRVAIHHKLFDALQSQNNEDPAILAHHAQCANQVQEAVKYRVLAGQQAMARPAFQEAINHFERAVSDARILRGNADGEAALLEALTLEALAFAAGLGLGHPRTISAFEEANELLNIVDHTPPTVFGSSRHLRDEHHIGRHDEALRNATQIVDTGLKDNNPLLQLIGYRLQGMSETYLGKFERAHFHFEKALALYDSARDARSALRFGSDIECGLYVFWAIQSILTGQAGRSESFAQLAEARARQLAHPFTLSMTLNNVTQVYLLARLPDAKRIGLEVMDHARENGMGTWRSTSLALYGAILNANSEHEEAVQCLGEAIQLKQASGTGIGLPWNYAVYSSSLAAIGKEVDAKQAESSARELIKNGSEQFLTVESMRLLANANHQYRGDTAGAVTELISAVDIAKRQGAWLLHVKAAVSLAKIWVAQNEQWRCAEILRPVLDQFPVQGRQLADYWELKAVFAACEDLPDC